MSIVGVPEVTLQIAVHAGNIVPKLIEVVWKIGSDIVGAREQSTEWVCALRICLRSTEQRAPRIVDEHCEKEDVAN